ALDARPTIVSSGARPDHPTLQYLRTCSYIDRITTRGARRLPEARSHAIPHRPRSRPPCPQRRRLRSGARAPRRDLPGAGEPHAPAPRGGARGGRDVRERPGRAHGGERLGGEPPPAGPARASAGAAPAREPDDVLRARRRAHRPPLPNGARSCPRMTCGTFQLKRPLSPGRLRVAWAPRPPRPSSCASTSRTWTAPPAWPGSATD